jgi:hypothetical protein
VSVDCFIMMFLPLEPGDYVAFKEAAFALTAAEEATIAELMKKVVS